MSDIALQPGWATYLRVSDEDKQTPERSFAMQRQRIQEHLLAPSNVEFQREYFDLLTGTSPNRKDYQQMLADAQAGRFSHLGLYRADRFGRNAAEGLQAATKLISWGVKLRVANMPSLQPETPDGFFMFLLQMGLAQREVDVLRQRTNDGMEAKLRVGGWAHKAPEGYVNKERQIKSGKYERWVELDPEHGHVLREAWDLLLSNRYTLAQICEELARRGYVRQNGRPWAWTTQTGKRKTAKNRLQAIFHNPFYAGWVVSERFGIRKGEIRGTWEPIVSTDEFERGVHILRRNDHFKSRKKRQFYLLRGLLFVEINGRHYKLYGSTPTGRSKSYPYYITGDLVKAQAVQFPCAEIDKQIPAWLRMIAIEPALLSAIRQVYESQIRAASDDSREDKLDELHRRIEQLREEEATLGRLLITAKISEDVYDQLRLEWREKLTNTEIRLADLERDATLHLDDLNVAIMLLTKLPELYERLPNEKRAIILKVLAKKIIISPQGEILEFVLNAPFSYLQGVAEHLIAAHYINGGSRSVRSGVLALPSF